MFFPSALFNAVAFIIIEASEAVSYRSTAQASMFRNYTLIAMGCVVLVPVLIGIIYTRIMIRNHRRKAAASDLNAAVTSDLYGAGMTSTKARVLDMRTNPVLRMWWKRQAKMYGGVQEADLEAQAAPRLSLDASAPKPDKKDKKLKKVKKDTIEPETQQALLAATVPVKPKKEKKDKKDGKADDASLASPVAKSKKDKKRKSEVASDSGAPAAAEAHPQFKERKVTFAP